MKRRSKLTKSSTYRRERNIPIKRDLISENAITKPAGLLSRSQFIKRHYPLDNVEDNRRPDERARLVDGRLAKILTRTVNYGTTKSVLSRPRVRFGGTSVVRLVHYFKDARRTAVCIRRQRRKEVLHAFKKTGRGSGGGQKRYNQNSLIKCFRR